VIVQGSFVAPGESSLESAVWAAGGVWDIDAFVKFLVLGGDLEGFWAEFAVFGD